MRYFDALLFCIANAFYQRNTAPLRLYKSLLLARPARAIGAKNTDDAPERPSDFTQYNFKAFTDSGEDSSSDNSDSATRLFQNEVRDRIYYINEHASYTSIKSTLDFIFKASETKHIPERFWYVALDATLKRKADLFAYQVFNHMLRINLPCTSHQLTSLLVLLSDKLTHEECLKCFDNALAVGLEPTVHNFSPLLKSCGGAQRAREILARMQLARIEPNVISFSAAIKSCEQVGDWQSSIELLELMRAYGVQPNEITFCCIISAASKGWASDIAVSILREMPMSGVPPNPLCYACTITACARCKVALIDLAIHCNFSFYPFVSHLR